MQPSCMYRKNGKSWLEILKALGELGLEGESRALAMHREGKGRRLGRKHGEGGEAARRAVRQTLSLPLPLTTSDHALAGRPVAAASYTIESISR